MKTHVQAIFFKRLEVSFSTLCYHLVNTFIIWKQSFIHTMGQLKEVDWIDDPQSDFINSIKCSFNIKYKNSSMHLCLDKECVSKTLNNNRCAEIPHESSGCSQCLLEFLLERLQVESCHVKLKVRTDMLKWKSHIAKGLPPSFLIPGSTKAVAVFIPSGAENLRLSLQPRLRPVPHRTAKELHLYTASFRFYSVLH